MEPVALAALLTELFLSIHDIGGYPVPEVYPEVHQVSHAELQQRFCKSPCGVKAFYATSRQESEPASRAGAEYTYFPVDGRKRAQVEH